MLLWFLDCAAANTVWQLLANAGGLILQIPLSSPLARVLKPTWHTEQQEIKLWSALVCWADLLPRCSLIIQGPWNAALLGPLQILRLCLALVSAASQSFYLSRRGSECAHQHSRYCPCCYLHTHNTQTIEHRTFPWNTNQYIVTFVETKTNLQG